MDQLQCDIIITDDRSVAGISLVKWKRTPPLLALKKRKTYNTLFDSDCYDCYMICYIIVIIMKQRAYLSMFCRRAA